MSQERIVQETWGRVVDMPAQPADILSDLNKDWTGDAGDGFTSTADTVSVNATTAVLDLKNDQPMIIGALGHAMVLTALTSNIDLLTGQWAVVSATVRDPWPYNQSTRYLSPNEWYGINFAARIRVS